MAFIVFKYETQRTIHEGHSRTTGQTGYANICECSASFGDFYLYQSQVTLSYMEIGVLLAYLSPRPQEFLLLACPLDEPRQARR